MASTSNKRKHTTLTLNDKWAIIQRYERGETPLYLSGIYGVGRATIYDIVKRKDKIEKFIKSVVSQSGNRKTLKIIEEFTAAQNDPEDAGRTNDEVEVSSTQFTVSSDEATLAATTLLRWSRERGVDMETVLQLKKVQEKVIAESCKRKKQKSILDYIC